MYDIDQYEIEKRKSHIITILEKRNSYCLRTRNKIDILAENFLQLLEDDIHDMICDNNHYTDYIYDGLHSDRDTEPEVESTLRLFPEILVKTKLVKWVDEDGGQQRQEYYPIQLQTFTVGDEQMFLKINPDAVSFIPLFARLAIEYCLFEEEQRGCLVVEYGTNVIRDLMELRNPECHEVIEEKYLEVMKQLRSMGLFRREDIRRYNLLTQICVYNVYFPKKRLNFLIDWDPEALTYTCSNRNVPLHYAALNNKDNSINGFQFVFDYGIKYYPRKNGIRFLFKKDRHNKTAFQFACEIHGRHEVMRVIEETLTKYSDTPINVTNAILFLAHEENIHLDDLFFNTART